MKPANRLGIVRFIPLMSFVLLFAIALTSVLLTTPEKPKSKNTPITEFSAERAFEYIRVVAQQPHMTGTAYHDSVCTYIAATLEKIGVEVDIQTTTATNNEGLPIFGNVANVLGRIRGTDNSKAILLVAHYDTQPHTPGAADDGIAVGSMLEAARVLKNTPQLKNDIIFLFSDSEEVGLLGAKAFADEHPWANDVGLVLNLEARGNTGAVLAFEVSPENGWIIREFAKGVNKPFAGSMMYEIYKLMPNDTDFTIFKNRGYSGFNVALVEGLVNYHSAIDKPENLNLGSVQHMGGYIMGIASHFGDLPLTSIKANDLVYFNIVSSKMVFFPSSWNVWIFIVIILLFILYLLIGYGRSEISLGQSLFGLLGFTASLAIGIGLVWGLNTIVKSVYPHYNVFYMSTFYNVSHYFYAYMVLAFVGFVLIYGFVLRQITVFSAMTSVLLVFIVVTAYTIQVLPTASYLTFVPLFFVIVSLIVLLIFNLQSKQSPFAYHTILLLGVLPTLLVISPYIYLIFHIFGLKLPIAGVGMLMLVLLFSVPLLTEILQKSSKTLLTLGLLTVFAFLLIAHFNSNPSDSKPLQSNVMYAVNNADSTALWVSTNHRTDEWNQQFFANAEVKALTEFYPDIKKKYLTAEADYVGYQPPLVENIQIALHDSVKVTEFILKSKVNATMLELVIPKQLGITSVQINGKHAHDLNTNIKGDNIYIRLINPNELGDTFRIVHNPLDNLALFTLERKLGIPLQNSFKPMPPHIVPDTDYESYVSLVMNRFELNLN